MKSRHSVVLAALLTVAGVGVAGDWPQWRGANRDAHAEFQAPAQWPAELQPQWKTPVGLGVSTPALVGERLYVASRQGNQELITCLNAANGEKVWQDKYETTINVTGPAGGYAGPRSSPAVANGKVVTLDEGATVSCLEAEGGKVVWRKDFAKEMPSAWPGFYTSLSPLIVDGMAVVHLGGGGRGGPSQGTVYALDLNSGEAKWTYKGEAPAYASPAVMTAGGVKQIVEVTAGSVVGLNAADGTLLWQVAFGGGGRGGGGRGGPGGGGFGPGGGGGGGGRGPGADAGGVAPVLGAEPGPGGPGGGGRGGRGGRGGGMGGGGGMSYNAASPIVVGETVIVSAPSGMKAYKIEKEGEKFAAKEAWTSTVGTQFNTPVLADGKLFGISGQGTLFAADAASGKVLWQGTEPVAQRGFGTVVAAGGLVMALTPRAELIVFKPGGEKFEQVARVKLVGAGQTDAYPVLAGKRIYVKDRDTVGLYPVQ